MIDLEWEVVVKHFLCEANQCVDVLANYGCSLNGESSFGVLSDSFGSFVVS